MIDDKAYEAAHDAALNLVRPFHTLYSYIV